MMPIQCFYISRAPFACPSSIISHEITYEYTQSSMVKCSAYHQSVGSVINEP